MTRPALLLLLLPLVLVGCPEVAREFDFDGDGAEDSDDCAPSDPTIFPQAEDTTDNGIDNNCDGIPGVDTDRDSYASVGSGGDDCNDADSDIHPGATEVPDNEVDEDCDGAVVYCNADQDALLNSHPACGGDDCDDTDASCLYAADCEDLDLDGWAPCKGDCDDQDGTRNPDVAEACDGLDTDCDEALLPEEVDEDGDGEAPCEGDCDDGDAQVSSFAAEQCNGLDDDCDPATSFEGGEGDTDGDTDLDCHDCWPLDAALHALDSDGDGVDRCSEDPFQRDCDDSDPAVYPGAPDSPFDGPDTNCDLVDGVDADHDGWPYLDTPGEEWQALLLDCDDSDPALNLDDADGDDSTTCAGDCDDADPLVEGLDLDDDAVTTCGADGVAGSGDEDCDDLDATVFFGGVEVCDMLDNDCSGAPDADEVDVDGDGDPACSDCDDGVATAETLDTDGDGFTTCGADMTPGTEDDDCNDGVASSFPGAADDPTDGVDANCDGVPGVDEDKDGWAAFVLDCDDSDAALNLDDADGDGVTTCGIDGIPDNGDEDCDDADPGAFPGNTEDACDGYDSDCVPDANEVDADGDGWFGCAGDCDDTDAILNPQDADADGWTSCAGDCDDSESQTFPGAAEQCDLADNDCDGMVDDAVDVDADGDGWFPCQGDCDDLDPTVYPSAPELCDGVDNPCVGSVLVDEADDDADGWRICAGDCDDTDLLTSPDAAEVLDGLDNDCDGVVDDNAVLCDVDVPLDQPTIQGAIEAAVSGDVVCVGPGTYVENLDFGGKAVHVVGRAARSSTVIDGGGNDSVVVFESGEGPDSILEGFTLTGGVAASSGGGVHVEGASPVLSRLAVTGNTAPAGGGLSLSFSDSALSDLVVSDNSATTDGGGLFLWFSTSVLSDLLVSANTTAQSGGGVGVHGGSVSFADVTIVGNTVVGNGNPKGGGLYVEGGASVVAQNLRLLGNHATSETSASTMGGGAYVANSFLEATALMVVGNVSDALGGGLFLAYDAEVIVVNAAILSNVPGDALFVQSVTSASLTNVLIAENMGSAWTISMNGGPLPTFTSCAFWNNGSAVFDGFPDPTGTDGNLTIDPELLDLSLVDPLDWDLHLSASSPLIDAGDPSVLDPDGSPSDIGAYGGPLGAWP